MFIPDRVLDHVAVVCDEPDLTGTKYTLVRQLGRGGMGIVYAVMDAELGREVAMKVASADDVRSERARREARVLAKLEHPSIVPVHDTGTLPDGRVFYVMKLVRGERLDRWLLAHAHALPIALRLFQRICEAIAFANAHDVVHRDLKPDNVMVGEFGEALVMDWGLAKEPGDDESSAIVGTREYMAPEQSRGEPVTSRADVYALGKILSRIVGSSPPKPLASIVARAISESPSERYETASRLSEDVGRFLDGERVLAHQETLVEIAGRFASRHRVVLTLLGAYLVVRVILIVASRAGRGSFVF